jgi:hypothetical protein
MTKMLICLHQQYYLISDICFHALCFKSCFFHIIILSQILAKLFPKYLASGTIKLPQQRAGCHLVLFIFRTPIGRERRNSSLPSRGDLKVARKYLMWASSGNLHVNIFFPDLSSPFALQNKQSGGRRAVGHSRKRSPNILLFFLHLFDSHN